MQQQDYHGTNNEYLELREIKKEETISFDSGLLSPLIFIWVRGENGSMTYEERSFSLEKNTVLCLSVFDKIHFDHLENARFIKFNREFYCVLDHDKEVSCKGILFYGTDQLPHFQIPETELENFEIIWKMFGFEMQSRDELQLEMLQMLLKRFIILSTRMFKAQHQLLRLETKDINIVREFSFLVEQNFKTVHSVQAYAALLNKSAKTLSNIFSKLSGKTPLQIIHDRKILEARRLLRYTDKSVKEITYELGFEDIQTFSRFFKKIENVGPVEFKNGPLGNMANLSGTLT